MSKYLDTIKNPPMALRSVPFWSWNDRLSPDEVARQIGLMHEAGIGGYFMHARGGLETEYLGEDWYKCIEAGMDAGEKLGMQPWAYDEEGWPSGFAGGKVTALGDRYHARELLLVEASEITENVLGIYGETPEGGFERCREGRTYARTVAIAHKGCPFYVDVMSKDAIRAFIDTTHEEYYKRFGDRFGKAMMGFFTDEPRLMKGMPWSYTLPEKFMARCGYDILEKLPYLFLEAPGYEKVRYDFWLLVNDLFVENFMKQLYDWCEAYGCRLTGHMMMEENLYSQMAGTGGSMPFYEYMHVPGVDWLRRSMGNPVMTKQVGSAAEQLGKKQVLTETYALSGWDLRPEEMRWMAGWQYVSGVNLMCQHLEGYTLRGLRKRDYPPSLFTQLPWWPEYRRVNDWFGGAGALLTGARKVVNIALLHPMRSGYVAYNGGNNAALQALDDALEAAAEKLSGLHLDYHFIDETLLARHGGVDCAGRLTLSNGAYSAVLLPDMLTIAGTTLSLLERFAGAGGLIITLGRAPSLVDGVPSERLARLPVTRYFKDDTLLSLLTPLDLGRVTVRCGGVNCADIRVCRFEDGDARMAFLVNLSKAAAFEAEVSIPGQYQAAEVLLESGEHIALPCRHESGYTVVPVRFDPMRVMAIYFAPAEEAASVCKEEASLVLPLNPARWQVKDMGLNALTMDQCEYRVDGGVWQPKIPLIHLMKKLLATQKPCDLSLRFQFTLDMEPDRLGTLLLAHETPERFTVRVNGQQLPQTDAGWIIDTAFHKRDIKPYVRRGVNEIEMDIRFHQSQHVYDTLFGEDVFETELNKLTYDTELESIYLFGDFGACSETGFIPGERNALTTAGPFTLREAPQALEPGSFTQQGLLFYQGRLTLSCQINVPETGSQRVMLRMPPPRAAAVQLEINGKPVKTLLWGPYEADVTEYVHPGANAVTLTLISGLRNLLGPHHHVDGELYNVGPVSFTGEYSWCERPTEGTPDLPEMRAASFWADSYCFVKFGLG